MRTKNPNPVVTEAWQRFVTAKQLASNCTVEQAPHAWSEYNRTYDAYVNCYNREVQAGWRPYTAAVIDEEHGNG